MAQQHDHVALRSCSAINVVESGAMRRHKADRGSPAWRAAAKLLALSGRGAVL